jgi:D-alanyl-D-alanine dipeptidase
VNEKGIPLDFGTPMHALEKNSYVFSPFISDKATLNRKLLRHIMQSSGFAPYDGEWWHFSYGDRE